MIILRLLIYSKSSFVKGFMSCGAIISLTIVDDGIIIQDAYFDDLICGCNTSLRLCDYGGIMEWHTIFEGS